MRQFSTTTILVAILALCVGTGFGYWLVTNKEKLGFGNAPQVAVVPADTVPQQNATDTEQVPGMPVYDVKANCAPGMWGDHYATDADSVSCLQQEQSAYDSLKSIWQSVAQSVAQACDAQTRQFGGPGSYVLLKNCVEAKTFQFQH
jgi:hypothetical protein